MEIHEEIEEALEILSPEQGRELYQMAHHYYSKKKWQDSSWLFHLLTLSFPFESGYWKGLGASLQMLKRYEEAINAYAAAQLLKSEKLDPYLNIYIADCYFALNDRKKGLLLLDGAETIALKDDCPQVIQHVSLMRHAWKKTHPKNRNPL